MLLNGGFRTAAALPSFPSVAKPLDHTTEVLVPVSAFLQPVVLSRFNVLLMILGLVDKDNCCNSKCLPSVLCDTGINIPE